MENRPAAICKTELDTAEFERIFYQHLPVLELDMVNKFVHHN
jgi:hypothetical protein